MWRYCEENTQICSCTWVRSGFSSHCGHNKAASGWKTLRRTRRTARPRTARLQRPEPSVTERTTGELFRKCSTWRDESKVCGVCVERLTWNYRFLPTLQSCDPENREHAHVLRGSQFGNKHYAKRVKWNIFLWSNLFFLGAWTKMPQ